MKTLPIFECRFTDGGRNNSALTIGNWQSAIGNDLGYE